MVVLCFHHSQVAGSIPQEDEFSFYFPDKQRALVLKFLMRLPNTSGLPAQWKTRFTQSLRCMVRTPLCLNFLMVLSLGVMVVHLKNEHGGPKIESLGMQFFLLEYLCVQVLFWSSKSNFFFLSSTLLLPHIFALNILASNL